MAGACIYVRVSSEGQIERSAANLPTPEKKCRDHCKRNSLPVTENGQLTVRYESLSGNLYVTIVTWVNGEI
jgi:hypothetical protein